MSGNNGSPDGLKGIDSLKALQSLNLSNNAFTGPFPADLFKLSTLEYLYMSNNNFNAAAFSFANNQATNLKVLSISNINITGTFPAQPGSIIDLDISYNSINTITSISNTLQRLNCTGNNLSALPSLTLATSLEELYAGYNNLTTMPNISTLSKLKAFHVPNNQITGLFPDFTANPKLKSIDISGNRLRGKIPSSLETLSELLELNIANNQFVGPVSNWVKQRHSLRLDGNFLLQTEVAQKSVSPDVLSLILRPGETVSLTLGSTTPGYSYVSGTVWTMSPYDTAVAAVSQVRFNFYI